MNDHSQDAPPQANGRFIIAVGGLLVLTIALLAGLWIRERKRAQRAEQKVVTLTQQNSKMSLLMWQKMQQPVARTTVPRDRLKTRQVTLDGREVAALLLPAGQAQRLGFRAGDVVLVEQMPTTATAPADPPPAAPATGPD